MQLNIDWRVAAADEAVFSIMAYCAASIMMTVVNKVRHVSSTHLARY